MSLNRRDFVKLCTGTVAGFGVAQMFHPAVREALAGTLTGERPPVIWLQGQGCTGCSVSLLNNVNPSIADVLLKIISLEYHPTVMGGEGHDAYTHMLNIAKNFKGKFFLAIEGSIPLAKDGRYCVVAEEGHTEITMADLRCLRRHPRCQGFRDRSHGYRCHAQAGRHQDPRGQHPRLPAPA